MSWERSSSAIASNDKSSYRARCRKGRGLPEVEKEETEIRGRLTGGRWAYSSSFFVRVQLKGEEEGRVGVGTRQKVGLLDGAVTGLSGMGREEGGGLGGEAVACGRKTTAVMVGLAVRWRHVTPQACVTANIPVYQDHGPRSACRCLGRC